jgi:hypothetical protein
VKALETRISEAIDALDVPDVDLGEAVLARLQVDPSKHRRSQRPAYAAALPVLALSVLAVLLIAPARDAVAGWLGIGATEIRQVDDIEIPEELSVDSLGTLASTVATAELAVDPIPPLGPPMRVFDDADRGRSYTWRPTVEHPSIGDTDVAIVLSVRQADRVLSFKLAGADVEVVNLADGTLALWVGGVHPLVQEGSSRPIAANQVLLWASEGLEYRLESALQKEDVVALADHVEEGTDLLAPG